MPGTNEACACAWLFSYMRRGLGRKHLVAADAPTPPHSRARQSSDTPPHAVARRCPSPPLPRSLGMRAQRAYLEDVVVAARASTKNPMRDGGGKAGARDDASPDSVTHQALNPRRAIFRFRADHAPVGAAASRHSQRTMTRTDSSLGSETARSASPSEINDLKGI